MASSIIAMTLLHRPNLVLLLGLIPAGHVHVRVVLHINDREMFLTQLCLESVLRLRLWLLHNQGMDEQGQKWSLCESGRIRKPYGREMLRPLSC